MSPPLPRRRLAFLCESGTDVRLVSGLNAHFDLVLLLRPAFGKRSLNWQPPDARTLRVEEGPPGRLAFAAFAARWLQRQQGGYDAVLSQNAGLTSLAANALRHLSRAPTFLLVCSPNVAYFQCRYLRGELTLPAYLTGRAMLEAARAANAILAERVLVLSRYLGDAVAPDHPEKVHVLPLYGVDTSRFTPADAARKQLLRERLGLPLERFIIFFSSRVAPEKDTESLLDACALLQQDGRDFRLLNLSGGYRQLMALAARKGLGERVIARDAVDPMRELAGYYQASDVCAQVSLAEGLGFSPLEALACGIPVVATD
ncbi:MAG: glycosyltransferase family 4 protein, partial [Myxococcaceae bacterium]|nr:glycosyltransferase family 4 protein [Myxococcaceae bacterium]